MPTIMWNQTTIPGYQCITRAVECADSTRFSEAFREASALVQEAVLNYLLVNNIVVLPLQLHQELSFEQNNGIQWLRMDTWIPEKLTLIKNLVGADILTDMLLRHVLPPEDSYSTVPDSSQGVQS